MDSKRLSVVYRLDEADMNILLPLEVTPLPRKTVRVGLVIVRNLDPGIGEEIDRLIVQLRDPDWAKREDAHKQLVELGTAARPRIEQLARDKDVDVAWHAERLLQSLNKPAGQ